MKIELRAGCPFCPMAPETANEIIFNFLFFTINN
jgi:glutaredoxin